MKSVAGQFLVSSPHLTDGNFFRTVVLIIDHDQDGAFGLVLTRPLNSPLREIWKMIGEPECTLDDSLFWGGPVQSPLIALHMRSELAETRVIEGVYLSTHKEKLEKLVAECSQPLRICSGYSGWGPGQLDGELKAGGWLLTPAAAELVFSPAETLWERAIRLVGDEILGAVLPHVDRPPDPSFN